MKSLLVALLAVIAVSCGNAAYEPEGGREAILEFCQTVAIPQWAATCEDVTFLGYGEETEVTYGVSVYLVKFKDMESGVTGFGVLEVHFQGDEVVRVSQ